MEITLGAPRAGSGGVGSAGLQREGDDEKQGAPSECKVGAYLIIIERVNLLLKIIFHEVGPARRAAHNTDSHVRSSLH